MIGLSSAFDGLKNRIVPIYSQGAFYCGKKLLSIIHAGKYDKKPNADVL